MITTYLGGVTTRLAMCEIVKPTLHQSLSTVDSTPMFCAYREGDYRYKPGTTAVLSKTVTPLTLDIVDESVHLMDTQ